MKPLINAENSRGEKIMVDLNDVSLNAAGTNMSVATYPEKELNRGNRKPVYEGYKSLKLLPNDKKTVEELFKLKLAEKEAKRKQRELEVKREKKNTHRKISA